jgi:hypothetical protein
MNSKNKGCRNQGTGKCREYCHEQHKIKDDLDFCIDYDFYDDS